MDVAKFIERAEQALRKRQPDQAIALYRQVLVASPGNAAARTGLLASYRRKAELRGGPNMLDKAAAKSCYAAALTMRSSRRHGAAAKSCDTGLERNPNDHALAELLGESLEAQGLKEEALAVWLSMLEVDDRNVAALKAAGRLHYELRQIQEALACLDRAHQIDRHDPEVERMRKNLAAEGTLAATRYETATSSRDVIKDKDAMRRAETGQRLHREAGQLAGDIEELQSKLAAGAGQPGGGETRRQLVKALLEAGRHDEAIAVLDEAVAAAPDDEALADARGDALLARNEAGIRAAHGAADEPAEKRLRDERTALEVEEFGRRVRLRPTDATARLRLARALYKAGETDKAIESFQAIVTDPRAKLDAQQGLGACFFRKGLHPLAARQFEAALASSGGLPGERAKEICYHLGLVSERMNDRAGALARYLQIYEVDINYRDVARKIEDLKPRETP
ncbi:MAG TPA: tetratricopeptide repeat protein [Kofleriaceae bacterium]|nr:tetratricopeptide repeat protein [Kofleriaceae bacterium]